MVSSSVICAYDASFGAGLLEALAQVVADDTRCVLVSSDETRATHLRTLPRRESVCVPSAGSPTPQKQDTIPVSIYTLTRTGTDILVFFFFKQKTAYEF